MQQVISTHDKVLHGGNAELQLRLTPYAVLGVGLDILQHSKWEQENWQFEYRIRTVDVLRAADAGNFGSAPHRSHEDERFRSDPRDGPHHVRISNAAAGLAAAAARR